MRPNDDPEYVLPEPMSDEQADDLNELAKEDKLIAPLRLKPYEQTDDYDNNERRITDEAEPCARCGKPVTSPQFAIHLINGGGTILHPRDEGRYDWETNQSSDLGWFPVGPDCAEKIGKQWCDFWRF